MTAKFASGALRPLCKLLVLLGQGGWIANAVAQPLVGYRLAGELFAEGDFLSAAIEYRRLALAEATAERRAACYWAAAFAYYQAADADRVGHMLDRAEEESRSLEPLCLLLRAESALQRRTWEEANFYLDALAPHSAPELQRIAAFRKARIALCRRQPEAARSALEHLSPPPDEAMAAIDRYARSRDRRPWLGGLLGLVPGAGYLYAGEPANALRSLLLNALFLWGMVDTARDDRWGAFGVLTFFEITWYSGSIYGGIDATHRYNRRRLEQNLRILDEGAQWSPDLSTLPPVTLKFRF